VVLIAGWLLLAAAAAPDEVDFRRLDKAAACLIRKDRVAVANWAATGPGSAEEASGLEPLSPLIGKCANGLAVGQVAGAVAMRLFNRYQTRRIMLPTGPDEANLFANGVLEGARDRPMELRVLRCAALMHPEAAEDFVRSGFGSRREAELRGEVTAAIASCTPAGERIRWTRLSLRLGLAREVYRASPAALLARGTMGAGTERAARAR
jgi:hypothetical protein